MEYLNELPTGIIGLLMAVVVYLAVIAAKRLRIVVTGDHARLANVILSMFLGLSQQNMDGLEQGAVALLASLASAALHELYKYMTAPKQATTEEIG